MTCSHNVEGDLPEFLCRGCHPELNATPEQRRAYLDAASRKLDAEREELHRRRELQKAENKLASVTRNGEPSPESVDGKIAAAMRAKIDRLKAEEW